MQSCAGGQSLTPEGKGSGCLCAEDGQMGDVDLLADLMDHAFDGSES